jgi:myosin heavy subunit
VRTQYSTFAQTHDALTQILATSLTRDAAEALAEHHWRVCAAILHLGQIRFEALETQISDPTSFVSAASLGAAANAATLLGCATDGLVKALTTRRIMGVACSRTPREAVVAVSPSRVANHAQHASCLCAQLLG